MKRKASGTKTKEIVDVTSVIYDENHWILYNNKRDEARKIMEIFEKCNIQSLIFNIHS